MDTPGDGPVRRPALGQLGGWGCGIGKWHIAAARWKAGASASATMRNMPPRLTNKECGGGRNVGAEVVGSGKSGRP